MIFMKRICDVCGLEMPLYDPSYLSNPNTAAISMGVGLPKDICSKCKAELTPGAGKARGGGEGLGKGDGAP